MRTASGWNGGPGRRRNVFSGHSVNCDIVVAATEAYIAALNKLLTSRLRAADTPAPRATPARADTVAAEVGVVKGLAATNADSSSSSQGGCAVVGGV